VINALIHQDYFQTGSEIQIRVYDDCVVITNPGGLPEGMTVDELRQEGHSLLPRNTLLAQVFYYGGIAGEVGHRDKPHDYPLSEPRDSRALIFCISGLVQRHIRQRFLHG
jgi:hypothetical protein